MTQGDRGEGYERQGKIGESVAAEDLFEGPSEEPGYETRIEEPEREERQPDESGRCRQGERPRPEGVLEEREFRDLEEEKKTHPHPQRGNGHEDAALEKGHIFQAHFMQRENPNRPIYV
jgi:hypothetical protein